MPTVLALFVAALLTAPAGLQGAAPTAAAQASSLSAADALAAVQKAIDQAPPASESAAEREAWDAQTSWLRDVHRRIATAAGLSVETAAPRDQASGMASGRSAPRDRPTGQATGQRVREASSGQSSGRRDAATGQASGQSAAPAPAMGLLELKGAIEQEARRFQTLSNASKARHDIAMNAIRNMKA